MKEHLQTEIDFNYNDFFAKLITYYSTYLRGNFYVIFLAIEKDLEEINLSIQNTIDESLKNEDFQSFPKYKKICWDCKKCVEKFYNEKLAFDVERQLNEELKKVLSAEQIVKLKGIDEFANAKKNITNYIQRTIYYELVKFINEFMVANYLNWSQMIKLQKIEMSINKLLKTSDNQYQVSNYTNKLTLQLKQDFDLIKNRSIEPANVPGINIGNLSSNVNLNSDMRANTNTNLQMTRQEYSFFQGMGLPENGNCQNILSLDEQKYLSDLIREYNGELDDVIPENKFKTKYSIEMIHVSNSNERKQDSTRKVLFEKGRGNYWSIRIKNSNKYCIIPKLKMKYYSTDHYQNAMSEVFEVVDFNVGLCFNKVRLIEAAIFSFENGDWNMLQKGKIILEESEKYY